MSGDSKESLEIRVVLKEDQVERFNKIQKKLGIESRADVLRYLINSYPIEK